MKLNLTLQQTSPQVNVTNVDCMVLQYNCSVDQEERTLTENMEPGGRDTTSLYNLQQNDSNNYMNDYKNNSRENLKRKAIENDCSTSSKFRPVATRMKETYKSPVHHQMNTHAYCRPEERSQQQRQPASTSSSRSITGKQRKMDLTLEWLDGNYMICEGVCLARCILYNHYRDFCERNNIDPACPATFGKTIRKKFPRVTTRRLGTRGHSKYHYYGIGIKETSIYYNSVYAGKGLTRFSPKVKVEDEQYFSSRCFPQKENVQTFLEEVPDAAQLVPALGHGVSPEEVQSFINLYKCSCQQILNTAQSQDLETISSSLLRYWSDIPFQHYAGLLRNLVVMDLITLCDSLLYDALIEVLLPLPCDSITERHLLAVSNLGKRWEEWSKASMGSMSVVLVEKKIAIARQFAQSIIRQISFIKFYRTVRSIFSNPSVFTSMRNDIDKIDLQHSGSQAFYSTSGEEAKDCNLNNEFLKELKELLTKNAAADMLVEWLDTILDNKVIKPSKQNGRSLKKRAQDFMLKWSFFGARITHNLNITNAVSFNSFHYLRMFLDEYILLAIETQFKNEKHHEIRNAVTKHTKTTKTTNGSNVAQPSGSSTTPNSNFSSPQSQIDHKNEMPRSEISKGWEFGTWSQAHSYEPFTKTGEPPLEVFPSPYYDMEVSNGFLPCPTQTYANFNYPGNHYTNNYQGQGLTYSCTKSDTLISENGSTFAYLGGAQMEKSQTYNLAYLTDNADTYSPAYNAGIASTTKEISSLNVPSFSEYKPVMENNVQFLQFDDSKPTGSPNCIMGQDHSSTTDISSSQLTFSEKSRQSGTEDGYLIQDISSANSPPETSTALSELVGVHLKSDFKSESSSSRQKSCFYPIPHSEIETTLCQTPRITQNPATSTCFFEENLPFSNDFPGSAFVPPQSCTEKITWNVVSPTDEDAKAATPHQFSTASTTIYAHLPSISSVLSD